LFVLRIVNILSDYNSKLRDSTTYLKHIFPKLSEDSYQELPKNGE